jgi:amino acid transporter
LFASLRSKIFGAPKNVHDAKTFHNLSLVAMLAWVGLGADGLSSSAYGPEAAFRELVKDGHDYSSLAVALAAGTALTVLVISYAYARVIEQFPAGGGGYVVASKLLGPKVGVVSGSALLVDYVLTITTSIAGGGDALFSLIPRHVIGAEQAHAAKLAIECVAILALMILNVRGVKESVRAVLPVFLVFVVTHAVLLAVAIGGNLGHAGAVVAETRTNFHGAVRSLGAFGVLLLFVRAYSLGGGTYTGIEAVSNGVSVMREPKVRTAKRTMVLMAASLAITAGGVILAYLLVHVTPAPGQTMNAVLLEKVARGWTLGGVAIGPSFVAVTLAAEAAILFVAAQAGFLDGPRVMANMATDSWLPHRLAALSDRLTMHNGVWIMGATSIAALVYTGGDVDALVIMYSINVFVTFSLSNLAMCRFWWTRRGEQPRWVRHIAVHVVGLVLCLTILVVTTIEKLTDGGWLTLVITGALVAACFAVKRHYERVGRAIARLDDELPETVAGGRPPTLAPIDAARPVAILFVGAYGGLGRHALLSVIRMFPEHFRGVVFCSIAIVDSGNFKGIEEVERLEERTNAELAKYVRFARALGIPAEGASITGTEVAVEAERLARTLIERYPRGTFVAGQLLFQEDSSVGRLLHNETAFMIQRRLQREGIPMVVLPVRLNLGDGPRIATTAVDYGAPANDAGGASESVAGASAAATAG